MPLSARYNTPVSPVWPELIIHCFGLIIAQSLSDDMGKAPSRKKEHSLHQAKFSKPVNLRLSAHEDIHFSKLLDATFVVQHRLE